MLLIARHATNIRLPNREDCAHHTAPLVMGEIGGHKPVSVRTPRKGQVAMCHLELASRHLRPSTTMIEPKRYRSKNDAELNDVAFATVIIKYIYRERYGP
ncbi:hypothetical protein N9L68_04690 [bacterium]|nr:hypothetical protein [bacterium]